MTRDTCSHQKDILKFAGGYVLLKLSDSVILYVLSVYVGTLLAAIPNLKLPLNFFQVPDYLNLCVPNEWYVLL